MKSVQVTDQQQPDGLRFKSKASGSIYGPGASLTLSCIKCGKHQPRSMLRSFKLAGAQHWACVDNCGKPPKTAPVAP